LNGTEDAILLIFRITFNETEDADELKIRNANAIELRMLIYWFLRCRLMELRMLIYWNYEC